MKLSWRYLEKTPVLFGSGLCVLQTLVADAVYSAQLSNVQVQELPGMLFRVASRWLGRIQSFEST